MKHLTLNDAEKIHAIIMKSGNIALINAYEATIKAQAEMKMGMYVQTMEWRGTALPEDVKQTLDEGFGIKELYEHNLLSSTGSHIELSVLAGALSEKTVNAYFKFDPQQRAAEIGVDFEKFTETLKAAFRGTIGRPGEPSFGILLDEGIKNKINVLSAVLGLGILRHPYDKDTIDRLSAKGDLDDWFKNAVSQGKQVYDKGIDAKSVYLITPNDNPLSVQVMAQMLNFQGASHYLPAELKK